MKIIDLLNKIANNEEMPKKIKYKDKIYNFDCEDGDYFNNEDSEYLFSDLFERCYTKEFINDEVKTIEEGKKIPEKLNVKNIDKCIHGVTHKEKELLFDIRDLQIVFNELIDYLKSKGE